MAEAELLSSTSEEVCELFDGNQIVRVLGAPDTQEFVYRQRGNERGSYSRAMAWGMREAWEAGELIFAEVDSGNSGKFATALRWAKKFFSTQGFRFWHRSRSLPTGRFRVQQDVDEKTLIDKLLSSAPNIILNVDRAVAPRWQLWLFAWIGIISQLAVLVFGALTTYHWRFEKGGAPIALYGYPCTLAGTLTVSVGLLLCSHVIEGSTDECKLQLNDREIIDGRFRHQILRIQRACVVSEQHFSSYALFNSETSDFLRTSRLNKQQDYNVVAAVGSSLAIAGFIVQFVGLRALHWSATIMQLGATVFMTGVRSYVRRGLAHDMKWEAIPEGEELGWFTEHVFRAQGLEALSGSYIPYNDEDESRRETGDSIPGLGPPQTLYYSLPPKPGIKLEKDVRSQLESIARNNAYTLPSILGMPFASSSNATIASEMIQQQSRLAEMSKWGQSHSEVAQSLVSAMLQIRDLIEDTENALPRNLPPRQLQTTGWTMSMILHPNDPHEPLLSTPGITAVSFNLPRIVSDSHDKDPTKSLRLEIGTLLSLWIRTINKRSHIPEWKINSPSALRRDVGMEMESRTVPKTVFLRIVASECTGDREEYRMLHFLEQWLETPIYRVPCPTGEGPLIRSGGAFGFKSKYSSSWEHLVHHHPVFGAELSSLPISNEASIWSSNPVSEPFTEREMRSIERACLESGQFPWCAKFNYDQTYESFNSFLDATQNVNVNMESEWIEANSVEKQWQKHAEAVADFVNSEDATKTELKADASRGENKNAQTDDIISAEPPSNVTAEKIYRYKDYLRRRIQPDLAIHCQGSLVQNCAQEIFLAFFLELISGVGKIRGTTVLVKPGPRMEMDSRMEMGPRVEEDVSMEMHPRMEMDPRMEMNDLGLGERRGTWVNDVIDKIAKVLYDCSLVESQLDGRNLIVPVLSALRLLPTEESSREKRRGPMDRWLVQM
ncbi:hypothetical protein IFR05_002646 [Cadophora sp. M221]|nr:hypothetical protein IFR05_002646 [Cadophora sp. M221]